MIKMNKKIALDIGQKRIGIANSDGLGMLAHPYKTLKWQGMEPLVQQLNGIIAEENIDTVIVGLPVTLKGKNSKKTIEIQEMVADLKNMLSVDVQTIDERLTTKMAEQALQAVGK